MDWERAEAPLTDIRQTRGGYSSRINLLGYLHVLLLVTTVLYDFFPSGVLLMKTLFLSPPYGPRFYSPTLTVSRDLGEALYIFWFKVKIKMTYFIFLNSYSQNKLYLYKFTINRIKNIQALKAIKLDYSVTSLMTRSLRLWCGFFPFFILFFILCLVS